MYSVTQRIKQITQPRGGYVKPKDFSVTVLDDKVVLNPLENIHPTLMGLVVDYLTRYATGAPLKKPLLFLYWVQNVLTRWTLPKNC